MSTSEPTPIPINITLFGDGGCGKSSITLRLVRSQWVSEYDPTIEDSYTLTRRIDGETYHLSLTDTAGQEEYRGLWAGGATLHGADAFLLVYDITNPASLEGLQYFHDLIAMEEEARYESWESSVPATADKTTLGSAARPSKKQHGMMANSTAGGAGTGLHLLNAWSKGKTQQRSSTASSTTPHDPASSHHHHHPGFIPPIKIVAGNKCDLAASRRVAAREGLDWARQRGCGFMETSARNTVNIVETFELLVRRVVEARRMAGVGRHGESLGGGAGMSSPAMTHASPRMNQQQQQQHNRPVTEIICDESIAGPGGTRRAVTRPLTPLSVAEGEGDGRGGGGQKRRGGVEKGMIGSGGDVHAGASASARNPSWKDRWRAWMRWWRGRKRRRRRRGEYDDDEDDDEIERAGRAAEDNDEDRRASTGLNLCGGRRAGRDADADGDSHARGFREGIV